MVTRKYFDNVTILASGSVTSEVQDMDTVRSGAVCAEGFGTVQYSKTGTGTLVLTPQFSNDPAIGWIDGTAVTLNTASNQGASVTISAYRYMRFKLAETGASSNGTATVVANLV